ncbi:MAG: hypothetical protein LQ348_005573 [Seirophora lacunosa]|nr:MAG: hypothetical protein LQ348_005573 [Seirophora lacunosa]
MYVFRTTVPVGTRILAVVSEGYTTRETCPALPKLALSQLKTRWPNSHDRTKLHSLTANWIGHLYINFPLGPNVPDGARLDVPNREGKSLTVDVHGRLEEDQHETTTTSWSTAATEAPLPNAQYQSYPMIINHLNRPCVLHAPWWDTIAGPKPGQFYPLTQDEYKKRKRLREQALRDLNQYGSPEWLAREPEGWEAWECAEELPCERCLQRPPSRLLRILRRQTTASPKALNAYWPHLKQAELEIERRPKLHAAGLHAHSHHAFAPQSLRRSAIKEIELQIMHFVHHPNIVERKAFYHSNGDRGDRLTFSQVFLVANSNAMIIANGQKIQS